ncbi:MAG: hypothetical protein WAL25_11305 [Acidimicrobiia bacterium]
MSEQGSRSGWWLPAGLAVLVIGLVAVALTRGPVSLDPDTPEGTVQEYLLALHEERWDDAIAVIHPQWLGNCDADDLSAFADPEFTAELGHSEEFGGGFVQEGFDAVGGDGFNPGELPGSDTSVEVTISRGDGGPFGSGWTEWVTFELVNEDDFWWISGDPWPGFVWNCQA